MTPSETPTGIGRVLAGTLDPDMGAALQALTVLGGQAAALRKVTIAGGRKPGLRRQEIGVGIRHVSPM
jgi:hypothetical protein